MPRAGWCTDPHLDWLDRAARSAFYGSIRAARLDALLVGGDIGLADSVADLLAEIHAALSIPICFVLGNHDYYRGSIATVRKRVRALCAAHPRLVYLTDGGVIRLSRKTALVGHDSWADGRFGDFVHSGVLLNDYFLIEDLSAAGELHRGRVPDMRKLLEKLNALGDEAARQIRAPLARALASAPHVFVLTHVPPFREACRHEDDISNESFLPHFACRAFGEVLLQAAAANPSRHITVLCGHTHREGYAEIRPNLRVWTGGASYGSPALQRVFDV
jgi:predicted phosphohydrolase